jgi:uridine kinase
MSKGIVVGIAGGSASGKSTLAAALADALTAAGCPAVHLPVDRYMYRDVVRGPSFVSPTTGVTQFNANHPDSVDWHQALSELDRLLSSPDGASVVVMEGLMVLHVAEVRERLDVRIFVELDADERALRRMIRDMHNGRGNGNLVDMARYYQECARIGHMRYVDPSRVFADLIVRGDAPWSRVKPLLLSAILGRLESAAEQAAPMADGG